jgi:hypothetical protein
MAFAENRFVRQTTAYNAGQITTTFNPESGAVIENGPAWFTYASATDALATIVAANYFADVVYMLAVNDRIDITGSDASGIYIVSAVNRDLGTISLVSYSASGVVGTANIQDGAVTAAKLATDSVTTIKIEDAAVTSAKIAADVLQYVAVPITAAEFNGMYAAPKELVAAAGADTLLVLDRVVLAMTYGSAAYAAGGVAHVQYDDTANGAGVIASTTLAAASFQDTASTVYSFNAGVVEYPFATCVNQGLFLSNITGAFTTGDSDMVAHVWFKAIPTV